MKNLFSLFCLLLLGSPIFAQNLSSLPRSTPEAEGVSSEGITNFLDAAAKSKHEFHSYMILRHGKVVAEGWWNPYRADLKHTLYSVSKSFTATAVGLAVAEGKLTVEDKVISFFPKDLPAQISPYLAELKVKDLLSMSVGQSPEPQGMVTTDNWIKTFLATPLVHQPGTKFLYNSAATYMLSAIVQKVTGEPILAYLQRKLFSPLGIEGMDWETDPHGTNTGGWGLRLKTEDMAKFGQLFLQKGLWKGKQILPAAWVEEASSMKIMQNPNATEEQKNTNDWVQGYCYQMWRCRNNAYRADGANGQYIIVIPEKDAVIAVTSETTDMQGELNLYYEHLFPAIQSQKLKANPKALAMLREKSAALALPMPTKNTMATEVAVSGKTYALISNKKTLKEIAFDFKNETCNLTLKTDSATHQIAFGAGRWALGETSKWGPYLVVRAKSNRANIPTFKVAGSYTWQDDKTLVMTLRYIESPHTETIQCTFDGDKVAVDFIDFLNKNRPRTPSKGIQKKEVANAPRLIVRGDDMGFSHAANEALIKSYQEGIETAIEVIVPSPWFPEAIKMLAQNPNIDVGLHFAITSEWDNIKWRPLTDAPSLRNKEGYFYQMLFHNPNYPQQAVVDNDWKIADYEKELRSQIEMAKRLIPRLSHVSGHMGSTGFADNVKALAKKIGAEYNLKMVDAEGQKDFGINYIGFDFNNKTTEERIEGFIKMLDKLDAGKTYVFVEHPGLDTDELRAISHIGYEDVAKGRQDVTNIFTNERVMEAIYRKGIQLVSYKEVLK